MYEAKDWFCVNLEVESNTIIVPFITLKLFISKSHLNGGGSVVSLSG